MTIEKSKDLSLLALDELIGNLKVHEVVMEKDFEIYRGKKERVKSIALKIRKESSDDETLTSGSDDKEYAMAIRNFKRFFRRKSKFVSQPREEKKSFRQRDEKKGKSNRKCFRCCYPNHLIEESIDSGFARFNTIITSLKALDEGFSSSNYIRKFLRALHPKWRAKVMTIEESKDLSSLALDELIGNLKVHEVVMEKDSKIYRGKKERIKSIALKAKKESSDDETSTSGSDDEENAYGHVVIQIISLAIVQNHLATKIKRPSLEVLGAIEKMTLKRKLMMKLVSWVNHQIRVHQGYVEEVRVERFKPTKTSMSTEIKLTKDDEADSVDSSKYQAEYISAGKVCQQALWMKQALIDYDICLNDVPIMCDNKGAIDLSKNLVQHSRTKHIEIRHHFPPNNVQKGNISIEKVASEDNIADVFTKPLKHEVFNYLRLGLGMM
nr:copia protein [Tanacetum cinerariifolium]